jgi:hypothetical protein
MFKKINEKMENLSENYNVKNQKEILELKIQSFKLKTRLISSTAN